MRVSTLGVVFLGALALVVGCGREEEEGTGRRPVGPSGSSSSSSGNPANPSTPGPAGTTSAAVTACVAAAAPARLSDAKDATDIQLAGTAVFFHTGTKLQRVQKAGTATTDLITSPTLARSFVDKQGLLLVEKGADGSPVASLRGFPANPPAEGQPEPPFPDFAIQEGAGAPAPVPTTFYAPTLNVFGADATSFYVLGEDDNNGTWRIASVNRTTLAQTDIVTSEADKPITNAVLSEKTIFWVEQGQRVKKFSIPGEGEAPQPPKEIFGLANCNLAIGASAVYCSLDKTIETRNFEGLDGKVIFASSASKSQAPFGTAEFLNSKLYVRSATPDPEVQHFIRSITPDGKDESFIACNRSAIRDVAADATDFVWADDTGVFMVPAK